MRRRRRARPFDAKKRTLELLRARGWVGDDVERKEGETSRDFLGFADLVVAKALGDHPCIAAVQATTVDHHAAHVAKMLDAKNLVPALVARYRIALVSWDQAEERVGRVTMFFLEADGLPRARNVNPDPDGWA